MSLIYICNRSAASFLLLTSINQVRDLKDDMQTLSNGMNTFNAVAGIAKYVPYIGTAVNIVKNTLTAIRTPFNQALARVKTIDAKIWPYKARCDTGVEHCETGEQTNKSAAQKLNLS